jgi:Spy/CpxP family protein refolding chaperone
MTQSSPTRTRTLILSLLLLAFIAGASSGVAGRRLLAPRMGVRTQIADMSTLLDQLDLSVEQRQRADSIVSRKAPRSTAIMLETIERLREVADSVDRELRDVLTDDQRRKLDAIRRPSRLMLRRKMITPRGTVVDTIVDTSIGGRPR